MERLMTKKKVVIVGGGTAGLIIAEKLKHKFDVTVLEKSKLKKTPLLNKIPLLIGPLYRKKNSKYIRRIEIVGTKDRNLPFFESCVLGGASVINGCVHALGSTEVWRRQLRRFSSGIDDIRTAYRKLYSENLFHLGRKIKLRLASINSLDRSFFAALSKLGIAEARLMSADNIGYGRVVNTVGLLFRSSVISILGRPSFRIVVGEEVRLIRRTDDNKYEINTTAKNYWADYVILSSGVIGTNRFFIEKRIIGIDNDYLRCHNAGLFIRDHPNVRVNIRSSRSFDSLNEINESPLKKFYLLAKHFLGFSTLLLGTGATSGVHLDIDGDGIVDTRIHLLQFSESGRHKSDGKEFCEGPGFSLSITPIEVRSSGKISFDKNGSPIVDPCYFREQQDLDLMKLSLQFCLNLLEYEPLREYVGEVEDYELIKYDPDAYIRKTFFSGHHLIGGCSNLIDQNFEVKENPGIFICDASVFSEFVSSNIHASVCLLAQIFSDRFVKRNVSNTDGESNARI